MAPTKKRYAQQGYMRSYMLNKAICHLDALCGHLKVTLEDFGVTWNALESLEGHFGAFWNNLEAHCDDLMVTLESFGDIWGSL